MSILASVTAPDIRSGIETSDSDGRFLQNYMDADGQPCQVLVIGSLVDVVFLDGNLQVRYTAL
jgi:hypothetical protein